MQDLLASYSPFETTAVSLSALILLVLALAMLAFVLISLLCGGKAGRRSRPLRRRLALARMRKQARVHAAIPEAWSGEDL